MSAKTTKRPIFVNADTPMRHLRSILLSETRQGHVVRIAALAEIERRAEDRGYEQRVVAQMSESDGQD